MTDFQWYIQVLIQLTRVEGTRHGKLLASQLMDVAIRVSQGGWVVSIPASVQCHSRNTVLPRTNL